MCKRLVVIMVVALMAAPSFGQLAGYWKFDETSGTTVLDSSGNGKTGVLYSVDSNANLPTRIAGHNSNALQFNASTVPSSGNASVVRVALGSGALVNLGEAFTISMWVRCDAVVVDVVQPGLLYTDAYGLYLATNPDSPDIPTDRLDYFSCDSNYSWGVSLGEEVTAQKTLGSWYHYAVTYDGIYLRKYVNGVVVSSTAAPTTYSLSATTNLLIGSRSDTYNGYFTGALDDVAVWSGKYLGFVEINKLAKGTATPLTVVESNELTSLPTYTLETNLYNTGGNLFVLNPDANDLMTMLDNQVVYNTSWTFAVPGSRVDVPPMHWYVKNEANYADVAIDVSKYGIEWVDQSWNGREPNMAVMAAYITPGLVYDINNTWYQIYNPGGYSWEDKPYFRTNIRVAAVNSNGASARITIYRRSSDVRPDVSNHSTLLTYIGEIVFPLDAGDYVWQHYEFTLPKPASATMNPMLLEVAIVGGTADTILYIDNLRSVSNQYVTFKAEDLFKDSFIDYQDLNVMADHWLEHADTTLLDPRSGGLLINGDFSSDKKLLLASSEASAVMNPTGWTFTGTGTEYGVARTDRRGRTGWYYTDNNWQTAGGDVSAFMGTDKVLTQTASATAVSGQTYYAMGYVLAYKYTSGNDLGEWYGWKDTATMEIAVDGVVKATFSRKLSRSIWRPLYGTYTAVPADAGKSIQIRFSYGNTYTDYYPQASNMYVGYAYLGTTVPDEWPEKRTNLLTNGGFEDLSVIQSSLPSLYTSLTTSDNAGAWFVTGTPAGAIPGWIYEAPTGYDMGNQGGIWSSAYYGAPIPSPGLNDVAVYAGGTLVYGQIVGALTPSATYYLDAACGVLVEPNTWGVVSVTWPNPAPTLHIELWRIPAGVTDPNVIHTGITTSQSGYVKIANADVVSTGDIKATRKWQVIGTSYTATSSDTNVYVRIYGTNPVTVGTSYPSFVYSDVYLSTQKRNVASSTPGNSLVLNVSSGTQYNALGAYNCYQASLMGFTTPSIDLNCDCVMNFYDFVILADEWLQLIGIAL